MLLGGYLVLMKSFGGGKKILVFTVVRQLISGWKIRPGSKLLAMLNNLSI